MNHLATCFLVANEAKERGKNPLVAVVYDELCRKSWAAKTKSKYPGFCVSKACTTKDERLVDRAFERFEARGASLAESKGKGKSKGKYEQGRPFERGGAYDRQGSASGDMRVGEKRGLDQGRGSGHNARGGGDAPVQRNFGKRGRM